MSVGSLSLVAAQLNSQIFLAVTEKDVFTKQRVIVGPYRFAFRDNYGLKIIRLIIAWYFLVVK